MTAPHNFTHGPCQHHDFTYGTISSIVRGALPVNNSAL
jgi:hypothetical protein